MNKPAERIACIVLAAGYSRRFGADKRSASIGSQTLLDLSLHSIPPLFCAQLLVLHPGDEALAARYQGGWHSVVATDAAQGMGHSLAAALTQADNWQGALVVLADMPRVLASTYQALTQALRHDKLVVPVYQGQRGNPVGIGAHFFPELSKPAGDSGARQLFQRYPEALVKLELNDPGILLDIDSVDALTQFRAIHFDEG